MPHKSHSYKQSLLNGLVAVALLCCAASAHATRPINLAWDRSSDSDVAGYNLFYGTASGTYTQSVNAGNSTTASISGLTANTTYFIIVTAYNTAGLQSLPSNEVSFTTARNAPPTVSLTSPQAGDAFNDSTPISITATADDSDGSITKVEFYADSVKVGQAAAAPFAATWSNTSVGNHHLSALAFDDSGAAVRSAPVSVTVNGSSAQPSPSPSATPETKVHVIARTLAVHTGSTGLFRVAASRIDNSQPLVVSYSMSGTATSGVHYAANATTGQVTIPAGARAATVFLNTMAGSTTDKKTAVMTVLPGTNYKASKQTATIVIRP